MRFVIIGGGPGGNTAATVAASLGAEVTLIERDIVGGAAHLWDCIPCKAMIATGGELVRARPGARRWASRREAELDVDALRERVAVDRGAAATRRCASLLESQGVRLIRGTGRAHRARTRSRSTPTTAPRSSRPTRPASPPARGPRVPDWAAIDGERILTTRQAYPPPEIPEHLVVIGSGVTGVEFTHMFSALGAQVTLIVSRQQVLPTKDPEVAAVLEDEFLAPRREAAEGRAGDRDRPRRRQGVRRVRRRPRASTARTRCSRSARSRTARASGCDAAGVEVDDGGYIPGNRHCQTNVAAHLRGRRRLRPAAAVVGRGDAGPQDRRARHGPHSASRTATSTTTRPRRRSSPIPRSPTSGSPRPRRSPSGRKLRVTKVPFANPKALIKADTAA